MPNDWGHNPLISHVIEMACVDLLDGAREIRKVRESKGSAEHVMYADIETGGMQYRVEVASEWARREGLVRARGAAALPTVLRRLFMMGGHRERLTETR